jgi:hypothetical protein
MSGDASKVPTAPVAAAGLLGGYAIARFSGRRELGGAALALAGAWCTREWVRRAGAPTAAGLATVYVAGFGVSHPLAKAVGAWPAVLTAASASAAASHLLADRRG